MSSIASKQNVEQLIPGSILINDRGEIYDRTLKNNGRADSPPIESASSTTKVGGYLTPKHVQRQIVTSPGLIVNNENSSNFRRSESTSDANTPGEIPFNRQQTFPGTQNKNLQTWVNPYWPNTTPTKVAETPVPQPPPPPQTTTPWVNPYWGNQPVGSTTANNPPAAPALAPAPAAAPTPAPAMKPAKKKTTTFLRHAWEDQQTTVFTFDFLPTPSFYERIYPLNVVVYSSNVPNSTNDQKHPNSPQSASPIVPNTMSNVSAQPPPPTAPNPIPNFPILSAPPPTSTLPAVAKQVEMNSLAPIPQQPFSSTFQQPLPSVSQQAVPPVPQQPLPSVSQQAVPPVFQQPLPPVPQQAVPSAFQQPVPPVPQQPLPPLFQQPVPSASQQAVRPVPQQPLPSLPQQPLPSTMQQSRFELGQAYPSSAGSILRPMTVPYDTSLQPGRVDLEKVIANRFPGDIPVFSAGLSASRSRLILYPLQKQGSVILI